jgi:hypothetical protein
MRIAEHLSYDQPPARPDDALQLAQCGILIRDLREHRDQKRTVKDTVFVGKRPRISLLTRRAEPTASVVHSGGL